MIIDSSPSLGPAFHPTRDCLPVRLSDCQPLIFRSLPVFVPTFEAHLLILRKHPIPAIVSVVPDFDGTPSTSPRQSQATPSPKMHNSCPKCGAGINGGSKTCSACGAVSRPLMLWTCLSDKSSGLPAMTTTSGESIRIQGPGAPRA